VISAIDKIIKTQVYVSKAVQLDWVQQTAESAERSLYKDRAELPGTS
jgi:hypothetical protein